MTVEPKAGRNRTKDIKKVLLDTALDLFTAKGYFNTSVHHIQKASKISIGSIYHHFKNKEAIAKALYDHQIDQMSNAILGILKQHTSTRDRCRAVVSYLFEMTETYPKKMNYMLHANHHEFIFDQKPVCSSVPFEMIANMVQTGINQGEIRDMDPIAASVSLFGGSLRLIHLKLDGVLSRPLDDYFEDVWAAAWRGVKVKK